MSASRRPYRPPEQGGLGQFVDSLVLIVLVVLSLLAPLLLQGHEAEVAAQAEAPPNWESLEQTPAMQAQWEKLGYDAAKAAPIVQKKFDYTIHAGSLAFTVLVIAAYFYFMLRVSDRQYREVIEERFGPAGPATRRTR
jgi:hypothetical protein